MSEIVYGSQFKKECSNCSKFLAVNDGFPTLGYCHVSDDDFHVKLSKQDFSIISLVGFLNNYERVDSWDSCPDFSYKDSIQVRLDESRRLLLSNKVAYAEDYECEVTT